MMSEIQMNAQEPEAQETEAVSEVIELEISEDDILYYITDQDDNEIGFAILEDGEEVEYFYETDEDYEIAEVIEDVHDDDDDAADDDDDDEELLVEMEVNDEDILYYLVDEDDNEIGFAIMEDGREVEYYYVEGEEADDAAPAPVAAPADQPAPAEQQPAAQAPAEDDAKALFTAEEISEMKDDVVGFLKDGASLAKELKSTYDEVSDALDFLPIKKKRRR